MFENNEIIYFWNYWKNFFFDYILITLANRILFSLCNMDFPVHGNADRVVRMERIVERIYFACLNCKGTWNAVHLTYGAGSTEKVLNRGNR